MTVLSALLVAAGCKRSAWPAAMGCMHTARQPGKDAHNMHLKACGIAAEYMYSPLAHSRVPAFCR